MNALNDLASQVTAETTMKTGEAQACFLNHCAINSGTSIIYYTNDMIILSVTNEVYLVPSKARTRNGAYIFMDNKERINQIINGPIMALQKYLK